MRAAIVMLLLALARSSAAQPPPAKPRIIINEPNKIALREPFQHVEVGRSVAGDLRKSGACEVVAVCVGSCATEIKSNPGAYVVTIEGGLGRLEKDDYSCRGRVSVPGAAFEPWTKSDDPCPAAQLLSWFRFSAEEACRRLVERHADNARVAAVVSAPGPVPHQDADDTGRPSWRRWAPWIGVGAGLVAAVAGVALLRNDGEESGACSYATNHEFGCGQVRNRSRGIALVGAGAALAAGSLFFSWKGGF